MSTTLIDQQVMPTNSWQRLRRWRLPLLIGFFLIILLIALAMRLETLGLPFDRDSYDEGVYWQSLRSMHAGYQLYGSIFYSQPPMFLVSVYPIYTLFGQSIWSARLGVALVSLSGFVGIYATGHSLRGWIGGVLAALLLLIDPVYLNASQILQAEGIEVAYSILAVGFAYLWSVHPDGWKGLCYASLSTLTLALSIFSKLFGLTAIIPVVMLVAGYLWKKYRSPAGAKQKKGWLPLLLGIGIFIAACLVIFLPFAADARQFWQGIVTYHEGATGTNYPGRIQNIRTIAKFLNSPLGYVTFLGCVLALWRKDWRILPLIGWLLTSIVILIQQKPLFMHHMVILIPELVLLIVAGIDTEKLIAGIKEKKNNKQIIINGISLILLIVVVVTSMSGTRDHYQLMISEGNAATTRAQLRVAHDLQILLRPDQQVITDGQFAAGLAQRNTPPWLVDTSSVRIDTGYVTEAELERDAEDPQVKAILFYTGRLIQVPDFHAWVAQHFNLVHTYGSGEELWVKKGS